MFSWMLVWIDCFRSIFAMYLPPCTDVPRHDPAEDSIHGWVVKFIDGDGIEVPQETWSDYVTTTT